MNAGETKTGLGGNCGATKTVSCRGADVGYIVAAMPAGAERGLRLRAQLGLLRQCGLTERQKSDPSPFVACEGTNLDA